MRALVCLTVSVAVCGILWWFATAYPGGLLHKQLLLLQSVPYENGFLQRKKDGSAEVNLEVAFHINLFDRANRLRSSSPSHSSFEGSLELFFEDDFKLKLTIVEDEIHDSLCSGPGIHFVPHSSSLSRVESASCILYDEDSLAVDEDGNIDRERIKAIVKNEGHRLVASTLHYRFVLYCDAQSCPKGSFLDKKWSLRPSYMEFLSSIYNSSFGVPSLSFSSQVLFFDDPSKRFNPKKSEDITRGSHKGTTRQAEERIPPAPIQRCVSIDDVIHTCEKKHCNERGLSKKRKDDKKETDDVDIIAVVLSSIPNVTFCGQEATHVRVDSWGSIILIPSLVSLEGIAEEIIPNYLKAYQQTPLSSAINAERALLRSSKLLDAHVSHWRRVSYSLISPSARILLENAVSNLTECQIAQAAHQWKRAFLLCREALSLSENLVADSSFFESIGFPEDQMYAIYFPLAAPLLGILLKSIIAKWRRKKDLK